MNLKDRIKHKQHTTRTIKRCSICTHEILSYEWYVECVYDDGDIHLCETCAGELRDRLQKMLHTISADDKMMKNPAVSNDYDRQEFEYKGTLLTLDESKGLMEVEEDFEDSIYCPIEKQTVAKTHCNNINCDMCS